MVRRGEIQVAQQWPVVDDSSSSRGAVERGGGGWGCELETRQCRCRRTRTGVAQPRSNRRRVCKVDSSVPAGLCQHAR